MSSPVTLHAACRDGKPQTRGLGRERIALLVAFGEFAQFADGCYAELPPAIFCAGGPFFLLGELADAGAGVAGVAFELLFLGCQFERCGVERPFAAVEQFLPLATCFESAAMSCSLRSRIDATSRRLTI